VAVVSYHGGGVVTWWRRGGGVVMLVRLGGTKDSPSCRNDINIHDERRIIVVRRVVATSRSATWQLEFPSSFVSSTWPALVRLVTWRCHVDPAVLVVGDGCG
jgi:hypothetical protein